MKKRTIIIYRKDIEYDLAATTGRLFNAREGDPTLRNQLRYESTPAYLALLARYLRKYAVQVNAILKPYLCTELSNERHYFACAPRNTNEEITDEATHESYRDLENDLEYMLFFTDNWDDKQFELLADGIYEYILNGIIFEFLRAVAPAEAQNYFAATQDGYQNVGKAITARILPQTRGRFPYDVITPRYY